MFERYFLDFSSAFNTINVSMLISWMSHLDVNIVKWVLSFLTDHMQYTRTGPDSISDMLVTNTGMPQGTVLSPVLFILYTDYIQSTCEHASVIKYADDTVLLGFIGDPAADNRQYFDEVNRIAGVCAADDLLLNASKTHEMVFTSSREDPVVPSLILDGTVIPQSDSVRYLGIVIDKQLRFSEQADLMISKAKQRMCVVRRFHALGADSKLVTQLYTSFIESKFMYAIFLYFSHLYSPQQQAMRSILREAERNGACIKSSLDQIVADRCKSYVMSIYGDESHLVHTMLDKMPSGRIRCPKNTLFKGHGLFLPYSSQGYK